MKPAALVPNLITCARVVLTPFIAAAMIGGAWRQAFVLGIVAGATDALDGLSARLLRVSTRVGAYLDPLADKLLLSVTYLALGSARAVPWCMVALVFGRDLFILAMAGYGYFFTPIRDYPPTWSGKVSTILQIVAALTVVYQRAWGSAPATTMLWLMTAGTVLSGVHYAWRGYTMLRGVRGKTTA